MYLKLTLKAKHYLVNATIPALPAAYAGMIGQDMRACTEEMFRTTPPLLVLTPSSPHLPMYRIPSLHPVMVPCGQRQEAKKIGPSPDLPGSLPTPP